MNTKIYKTPQINFALNDESHEAKVEETFGDSITIPKSITFNFQEYIITSIARSSLQKVVSLNFAPDSQITKLNYGIFSTYSQSSIKSISIPKSITIFEDGWCKNTPHLTDISISSQNTHFKYVDNTIIVGKSNPSSNQFDTLVLARRDVTQIDIPSSIKYISPYCFADCSLLKKVTFASDSQIKSISEYAFVNSNLTEITIPCHVELIDDYSFYNCKQLKTVLFAPNSMIQTIGPYAFSISGIENISLPSQLKIIGQHSFSKCEQLKTVTFTHDSMLESIEKHAFYNSGIESIQIPSKTQYISEHSFHNCKNLKKVDLPDNSELKSICMFAFYGCGIESIRIPAHVHLGKCCFNGCQKLKNIFISPENQNYKYLDDKFIVTRSHSDNNTFDKLFFARFGIIDLTIPSYIKEFYEECFHGSNFKSIKFAPDSQVEFICDDLFRNNIIECIKIPASVKRIGKNAFQNAQKLRTVFFFPNSKLEVIDIAAFKNSGLDYIKIPSSTKLIGSESFYGCRQLLTIKFESDSNVKVLESYCFACSSIQSITLPPSITTIDDGAFQWCEKLRVFRLEENSCLKSIHEHAFCNDPDVTYINGPSFSRIESIISPISKFESIMHAITMYRYDKLNQDLKEFYIEMIDERVDLDIIAYFINDVCVISLPNAKHVHLDKNCDFSKLYVPRLAELTGKEITNPKHQIIYQKKNEFDLDIMSIEEFEEHLQNTKEKRPIGDGATSTVYKVPNKNIENMFYAFKLYKFSAIVKTNQEHQTESKNNDKEEEDDWANDDDNDDDENAENGELQIDFEKMRNLFAEFEILNNLDHPNIVKAYSIFFGNYKNPPAILLEYFGHNLAKSIKKLKEIDLVGIIYEIAVAMNYVHNNGIIHRDLKPENILLDTKKHVKLCDFGIATIFDIETQKRTQTRTHGIGTLIFMAPELYDNSKPYNEKVDVYAFGIVMYFILTKGSYPDVNISDILNAKKLNVPNSINELSTDLILKCTAFDYKSRPSFSEIVHTISSNDYKLIDGLDDKISGLISHLKEDI